VFEPVVTAVVPSTPPSEGETKVAVPAIGLVNVRVPPVVGFALSVALTTYAQA